MSAREHEEVSEDERQFEDGSDPRVLDVIDIPILKPQPRTFQQENWLLDPHYYWTKVDEFSVTQLDAFVDSFGPLWTNNSSSARGRFDRVAGTEAMQLQSSLKLVTVPQLKLLVAAPHPEYDSRRRVQAWFDHEGVSYRLRVTDPVYERRYLSRPDGEYRLDESFLTISLGEPFQGFVYKLVAAIIEREPLDGC